MCKIRPLRRAVVVLPDGIRPDDHAAVPVALREVAAAFIQVGYLVPAVSRTGRRDDRGVHMADNPPVQRRQQTGIGRERIHLGIAGVAVIGLPRGIIVESRLAVIDIACPGKLRRIHRAVGIEPEIDHFSLVREQRVFQVTEADVKHGRLIDGRADGIFTRRADLVPANDDRSIRF